MEALGTSILSKYIYKSNPVANMRSNPAGKPVATLSLVGSSETAPPSCCRLWLSVDSLYGLRSEAGAIILVRSILLCGYLRGKSFLDALD
jgi:hypothetical protein